MSDGDNSDFLDDPKAYEDEQSDVFSGLSRRGSESYNQPPEELNLRKQDSGAKNPNMVVDLKTRLRKTTSESSEPMPTRQDMPIPPPPMYNPPISHQMPPQQAVEHSGKPVVEIGMRLKSIYPQRYFIFKNMKPQHFKFCKENNYGITQKTNENTLKSAFENSENLLIIFSNTEQRSFLGYARMESDYFDAPEMIDNFTKNSGLTRVDFDNNFIFRIEWKSKNTLRYEFVNHIKNRYNENREVNHSKVFQEVDPAAGKALVALLENPPTEPIAEHEPPEHKRDEQPPMPSSSFHNKPPKQEGGNFPPNNFMMNNPMMPPHFGYYPMNPMNPMGGQMGGMGGMGPMGGQGMFPGMPGQPGMMGGMPKHQQQQFPYNMNYNDYYMNMQQQQQQQQQQMMKGNKDKGRKKSASSSGSSSRSSSGSSRSSSPKKGSPKGGRRDSKSASRSRSKSHQRKNKMEKRGGGNNYQQKDYQKDYQKGGRKYDNQNPHQNYPHQNKGGKFQKFDKFDNKFDKNNNYNNNKGNYRGGGNNPHNRRRNSRSISPNSRNNQKNNRFNNNKNQRRSNSRSAERRHHISEDQHHKEENFETQIPEPQETQQQSPIIPRERSMSNHNEDDPFDFGDMEDRISEGGNDRKVEEERQDSPHAFDEDIRPGKRRSGSRSNKRSGSASSSKSVTESKSTTTKNQDNDFRADSQRKKKFSRDDEPLVITKGNNKIIGGKGGTERLIIGKPNKQHHSKQRSPDRSERFERHDRHERYDRHRNDRNDRRRSRERERNNSSKKSREREASRDRRDANRDRREVQRERREEKREEPKERRDEGYESKPKETPRREREPERSVESSETKGKRIDLRERLTQKDSIAPGSGSITNRIIKKN